MTVRWITAFVDLPSDRLDAGVGFWLAVTGARLSPARGADGEFATLLPPDGDPFLKVQRVGDPSPRIHLDLHALDVDGLAARASALGATELARPSYVVLRSPGGFVFCIVSDRTPAVRPAPFVDADGLTSLVDQVSIDVPAARFAGECTFWEGLTGWELRQGSMAEFAVLVRPSGMALRLLLQRLGEDDQGAQVRAHLDLACGGDVAGVADRHVTLGASVVRTMPNWTTLRDPAGMDYCLTRRDPGTGGLLS